MTKRRVNLTLPEELWTELRARVPERKLSQYIAEAAAARLAEEKRAALREHLKEQYQVRASQDRGLAEEFFPSEQQASDRVEA